MLPHHFEKSGYTPEVETTVEKNLRYDETILNKISKQLNLNGNNVTLIVIATLCVLPYYANRS